MKDFFKKWLLPIVVNMAICFMSFVATFLDPFIVPAFFAIVSGILLSKQSDTYGHGMGIIGITTIISWIASYYMGDGDWGSVILSFIYMVAYPTAVYIIYTAAYLIKKRKHPDD